MSAIRSGHVQLVRLPAVPLMAVGRNFSNSIDDAKETAASGNVTMGFDGMSVDFEFPQCAVGSDRSWDSLPAEDSATNANPASYTITFELTMTADNTAKGAEDAKSDGMDVDRVMDTTPSSPIETRTGGFEVARDSTGAAQTQGTINPATHRKAGLYIFRQTVDGVDPATTMAPRSTTRSARSKGQSTCRRSPATFLRGWMRKPRLFCKGCLIQGCSGSRTAHRIGVANVVAVGRLAVEDVDGVHGVCLVGRLSGYP